MALDPAAARLLRMLASAPRNDGAPPTVQSRRQGLRDLATLAGDPRDETVSVEDMVRIGLPLRLYRSGVSGRSIIVYLHGGGWVAGDLETHDGVCRTLAANSGCTVIAVDYPRPPEHPFPAAVEAAADVVGWAREALNPDRLVLAGDSAGAHVALCTLGLLQTRRAPVPDLLLLLCPIVEIEPLRPSRSMFGHGYFIDQRQFDQDVADYRPDPGSPIGAPMSADLAGHPPTLLHMAEFDPFRDEGLAYAERLRAAGCPVRATVHPGMIHYFYALPRLIPYARKALAEAALQVGNGAVEASGRGDGSGDRLG